MNTTTENQIIHTEKWYDKRRVHILNPSAGDKKLYNATLKEIKKLGEELIIGEREGNIRETVERLFRGDPHAHAIIYGGDGTVFEAVNGIVQSGACDTASFSVVKGGTGNDFCTYVNDPAEFKRGKPHKIDLVKTLSGGVTRYYANVMNMGFDCDVVVETQAMRGKTVLKGPSKYVAGVLKTAFKKKPINARVHLKGCVDIATGEPIDDYTEEGKFLLIACANSRFYGGGFRAAPIADISDGMVDVMLVKDIPVARFASVVGVYHDGKHVNSRGTVHEKFASIASYHRCRAMVIEGAEKFCCDGEVFDTGRDRRVEVEVEQKKVWYSSL